MNLTELQAKSDQDLVEMARQMGIIDNGASPRRHDLLTKVLRAVSEKNGNLMIVNHKE